MKRFNYSKVLFYLDPPYVLRTRHGEQYRCEMDDKGQASQLSGIVSHETQLGIPTRK